MTDFRLGDPDAGDEANCDGVAEDVAEEARLAVEEATALLPDAAATHARQCLHVYCTAKHSHGLDSLEPFESGGGMASAAASASGSSFVVVACELSGDICSANFGDVIGDGNGEASWNCGAAPEEDGECADG